MKSVSVLTALRDYALLVLFNPYFLGAFVIGYAAKVYLGGRMISIVTGLVLAVTIHELLKFASFK